MLIETIKINKQLLRENQEADDFDFEVADVVLDRRQHALAQYLGVSPAEIERYRGDHLTDNTYKLVEEDDVAYRVLTYCEAEDLAWDEANAYIDSIGVENLYAPDIMIDSFLREGAFDEYRDTWVDDYIDSMDDDELKNELSLQCMDEDDYMDGDEFDSDSARDALKDRMFEQYDDSREWAKEFMGQEWIVERVTSYPDAFLDTDGIRQDFYDNCSYSWLLSSDDMEIQLPDASSDEDAPGLALHAYKIDI